MLGGIIPTLLIGCRRLFSNTDLINKVINTFHTDGINSFSMYRYLTQPVDGIPKHTQRHDFKAFRLFKTSSG